MLFYLAIENLMFEDSSYLIYDKNIFKSAHDSDESNPASPAQSSDGSLIHEAASSASIIPCEYVPDIEASLQTLQKGTINILDN